LLTAAYVFAVVVKAMMPAVTPLPETGVVLRSGETIVLALAVLSLMLGCVALLPFEVVQIGRQVGGVP